jgi:hypothetical protein
MAGAIADDAFIRSKEPVRTNAASLIQSTSCEVGAVKGNGIDIGSNLTRDLTQNHIFPLQRSDNQRGPSF